MNAETLSAHLASVRQATVAGIRGLTAEDCGLQGMADASPPKWHLAHTTWFFETFVLRDHVPGYRPFDPRFGFLFNSYYEAEGARHARPSRGMLSRPTLDEVLAYRAHVDAALASALASWTEAEVAVVAPILTLGCHHEQQHQELLVTDIKYSLSLNPLRPGWLEVPTADAVDPGPLELVDGPAGLVELGHAGEGFAFDNEGPRHRVWLAPYRLANRLVTVGEYQQFVDDGGYRTASLWLSDGWAWVASSGARAPLYWDDEGALYTVGGMRARDPHEPVCHVNGFEADAFATWAGRRLPTEHEWEAAVGSDATPTPTDNLADRGRLHPSGQRAPVAGVSQALGDVWEWTASAYSPYPGYRVAPGALGEYNGKFMANQRVLRGASCATARSHVRATYRNFFYLHQRWQFSGIRLAEDA